MDKYSLLENKTLEMLKSHRMNCYICKSCHLQLQPKFICVCYNTDVHKDICKMYNKVDYDFSSFVISQYLGHVANSTNEDQYICASCDKRLIETSNEKPSFTILWKVSKCSSRSKLSESTESKTCICVHMLSSCFFHKTVQLFHTTDNDMSDEIVKECLSH